MEDSTITDVRQISSIEDLGLVDQNIVQVSCQRSISGDAFSQGSHEFNFNISGTQRWSPSRSYLRVRATVSNLANAVLTQAQRITIAENFMNNLYQNAYLYVGNQDVSSLSQFCGQVSTVRERCSRTKGYFDSIGRLYGWEPEFEKRLAKVTSDGNSGSFLASRVQIGFAVGDTIAYTGATSVLTFTNANGLALNTVLYTGDVIKSADAVNAQTYTLVYPINADSSQWFVTTTVAGADIAAVATWSRIRRTEPNLQYRVSGSKNKIEICFQPPLGIFYSSCAMPSGSYKLSLTPRQSPNNIAALESTTDNAEGKLTIDSLFFFMSVFRSDKTMDSGTYYLPLQECNIQNRKLEVGAGQNNLNFSVPVSTTSFAIFCQSTLAGSDKRVPASVFHTLDRKASLGLKNLQLTYANQTKPLQNYDSSFDAQNDFMVQRYIETQINNGLIQLSAEEYESYLSRGPIFYYNFVKSSDDRSTEVQLSINYENMQIDTNIFLVSIYNTVCKISVDSGFVTSVTKLVST